MILTITQHGGEPEELGHLLHKHPGRVHEVDLKFGRAFLFYPESSAEVCTAALMVRVDPVGLVRSKGARQGGWALGQYVNDRPYVGSSFLSVAISRVLGSALNGNCAKFPEFVEVDRVLEIRIPALAVPGGVERLEKLMVPLGYAVEAEAIPLDPAFPKWGDSRYFSVVLRTVQPLHKVLKHLFVLVPALDEKKHYWVGRDEIEKLLDRGKDWLAEHPEREWIVDRYLKFRRSYAGEALERLDPSEADDGEAEGKVTLHTQRLERVAEMVAEMNPASVLDLGCGEGRLLVLLLERTWIPKVVGMDVAARSLVMARERVARQVVPRRHEGRLTLIHGSLIYRDRRLDGFDVAVLVEVIEHLDPERLRALERAVFEYAAPGRVIVTTPNREYNALYATMEEGALRHDDHRFEWSRGEFLAWCQRVGGKCGYGFEIEGVGEEDAVHGAPGQMAVFTREGAEI